MLKTLWTALTAVVVLAGVLLTGIVASSALESTGGGAAVAELIPSVTCVEDLGASGFRAHFEYENTTGAGVFNGEDNYIEVDGGDRTPAPIVVFSPGSGNHAFDILALASVTWTLTDSIGRIESASATVESPPCEVETTTTVAPTTTSTTEAPTTTSTTVVPTTTSTTVVPPTTSTTVAPTTTTVPPTTTTCEPYICYSSTTLP